MPVTWLIGLNVNRGQRPRLSLSILNAAEKAEYLYDVALLVIMTDYPQLCAEDPSDISQRLQALVNRAVVVNNSLVNSATATVYTVTVESVRRAGEAVRLRYGNRPDRVGNSTVRSPQLDPRPSPSKRRSDSFPVTGSCRHAPEDVQ